MDRSTIPDELLHYEYARERLFCRLENACGTDGLRAGTPLIRRMDLVLTCYCLLGGSGPSFAVIPVREPLPDIWGIGKEQLFRDARANTEAEGRLLFERLDALLRPQDIPGMPGSPLYILTNRDKLLGAVYMVLPDILKMTADRLQSDLYVIPSSVHECLILPDDGSYRTEELNRMVRDINRSLLREDEVLSEHVYRVDAAAETITACTDAEGEMMTASFAALEF